MKVYFWFLEREICLKYFSLCLILIFVISPIQGQENIQVNVAWPTLSNSPSAMSHSNPQSNGRVSIIGPKTANVIWKVNYPGGVINGLAISSSNVLYFGTENTSSFIAMNADTTLQWRYEGNIIQFAESAILIDSQENIYFGSLNHYFYALRKNGSLKWKFKMDGGAFSKMCNIGLDSTLYFTSRMQDKNLYAIKSDGNIKWKISSEDGFEQQPMVLSPGGETIYICGVDSILYALNLDGSIKWKYPCGPTVPIPLVDSQGNIYIIPMQKPTNLISLKPDGTIRWKYTLSKNKALMYWSSPCMDKNGNIFLTNYDFSSNPPQEEIVSVDYYGSLRWEKTIDEYYGNIASPLACDAEGKIYFGSTSGSNYYCLDNDGNLVWKLPLDNYQVDVAPVFGSDGTLYIGVHHGDIKVSLIAVKDKPDDVEIYNSKPTEFRLEQNYPNPFNPTTTINYTIPASLNPSKGGTYVKLNVYDILGREVTTLVNEEKQPGNYEVKFDATNFPSGVYLYKLTSGAITLTKKMLLMK
jgi:outer membrane protein assembly factor BamB